MEKEELFNDDFLKQFKSGDELNGFLKELQKRGIEKMLEGNWTAIWIAKGTRGPRTVTPVTGTPKRKCVPLSGRAR